MCRMAERLLNHAAPLVAMIASVEGFLLYASCYRGEAEGVATGQHGWVWGRVGAPWAPPAATCDAFPTSSSHWITARIHASPHMLNHHPPCCPMELRKAPGGYAVQQAGAAVDDATLAREESSFLGSLAKP